MLTRLRRWAGVSKGARPGYRAVGRHDLGVLGNAELVEIGAHTVTHPMLATQSMEVQQRGIVKCKKYLEKTVGAPVTSFSYPYGSVASVGEEAVRLAREAGYEVACAVFSSPVTRHSSPYWLPRFVVGDWDGEEFAHRLSRWFWG